MSAKPQSAIVQVHQVSVLTAVVDDLNPEVFGALMECLLARGAWEATFSPAQTKKNRPAVRLEVICQPEQAWPLADLVLEQTTSLGLRVRQEERWCLERRPGRVAVAGSELPGKWAHRPSGRWDFKPEYDDCLALARATGLSLVEVMRAAQAAAMTAGPPLPAED